jgi:hypothetical protein
MKKQAKEKQNWTYENWRKVIFTAECPIYLSMPGNRQNGPVWALNIQKLSLLRNPSFLQKSWFGVQRQLQGCPSSRFCPQNKNVTARYYQYKILDSFLLGDFN